MDSQPVLAEELFPVLVWDLIFQNLNATPKDLITCYKTTQCWNNLLHPNRHAFLMAKVYPFIGKYLVNYKDICNARIVCRSWRWSVDRYMENHPHHTSVGVASNYNGYPHHVKFGFNLNSTTAHRVRDELSRVESGDAPCSSIPFFTRYISYVDRENLQRKLFVQFLNVFGSEIWHCQLIFDCDHAPALNDGSQYKLVRLYLRLLPNLRSLWVENYRSCRTCGCVIGPLIGNVVLEAPLTKLEHLEALTIVNVTNILETQLLTTFNKIRRLRLYREDGPLMNGVFRSSSIPVVMSKMDSLNSWYPDRFEFNIFKTRLWPISIMRFEHVSILYLQSVFDVASHFGDTLCNLHMSLSRPTVFRDIISNDIITRRQTLSHLKTFSLVAPDIRLHTVDFLGSCSSLETLKLEFSIPYGVSDNRVRRRLKASTTGYQFIIKFYGYVNSLYESNIWRLLPKLNSCTINITSPLLWVNEREYMPYSEQRIKTYTRYSYATLGYGTSDCIGN